MGRRTVRGATRTARAFAPGHVTGFFAPSLQARDPRGRGSVGAGLVLSAGVTAEASWTPGGPSRIQILSDVGIPLPISAEVARRLGGPLGGRLTVRLSHELPIGQGFGASASGALATGLAVARATGAPPARAVEVAHLAELFGGGGLGGVAAILGGGLEWRVRAGIPPVGRVLRRRIRGNVFVGIVGRPMASPSVLRDPRALRRIETAYGELPVPGRGPLQLPEFLRASEQFTDALRLGGPALRTTIRHLRGTGALVAQAMFGRSYFAVAPTPRARRALLKVLEQRGLRALELTVALRGAAVEPARSVK